MNQLNKGVEGMKDRLQFKVWDVEKEIWLEDSCLTYDGQPYTILPNNEMCSLHNVIVCFSTGLKDKQGSLIFEGDIMSSHFKDRSDIPTMKQIVIWIDREACFMAKDHPFNLRLGSKLHPVWWGKNCKIIGNIHENPDLLKV